MRPLRPPARRPSRILTRPEQVGEVGSRLGRSGAGWGRSQLLLLLLCGRGGGGGRGGAAGEVGAVGRPNPVALSPLLARCFPPLRSAPVPSRSTASRPAPSLSVRCSRRTSSLCAPRFTGTRRSSWQGRSRQRGATGRRRPLGAPPRARRAGAWSRARWRWRSRRCDCTRRGPSLAPWRSWTGSWLRSCRRGRHTLDHTLDRHLRDRRA